MQYRSIEMTPTGTIRMATESDVPAVRRLLADARHSRRSDERLLTTLVPGRHLIVLDGLDGGLVAAALFALHEGRGQLLLLVVSPECDDPVAVETRMFGVVEATCMAFGSATVDVLGQRSAVSERTREP
jgi:N-acetylglutamate synthase-like GNAT family acetyltransferase